MLRRRSFALVILSIAVLTSLAAFLPAEKIDPAELVDKADKQFEQKNYKDAANTYATLIKTAPKHEKWRHANKRIIICNLRLRLFDQALSEAEKYVKRTTGTPYEARAERLLGNLYMNVPHWGTRAGGKFHRAQWKQGIHLRSHRHDKAHAAKHLEKARTLYAKWDKLPLGKDAMPADLRKHWHNERIECLFDLAGIYARFGIYENSWSYWYAYWGERDDFTAKTVGEEDFDEYYNDWQLQRKRPIGLRLDAKGKPIFPSRPANYAKSIDDDQRILYLLHEARTLDTTKTKTYTSLSYYRQAMLSRARFGMDRLNGYASMYYHGGKRPLQDEMKEFKPWEMKDSESLILAGGKITHATLPPQWDVLKLLRNVEGKYPKGGHADEAQYAIGLYYQTRQQYTNSLSEYAKLLEKYSSSKWKKHTDEQIKRIKSPQVRISQSGVQLPGTPASLQISYRNTKKIYFVARSVNHERFMRTIRKRKPNNRGYYNVYPAGNWHRYFIQSNNPRHKSPEYQLAADNIGPIVAEWSDEVKDDGSHRYAHTTLQTKLKKPGAYLVYAYHKKPDPKDADVKGYPLLHLGNSRAVFAMTDLALVKKSTNKGQLYYVSHAQSGAPVKSADVKVLETWSTYDRKRRRNIYHRHMHEAKSNDDGFVLIKRKAEKRSSSLHALVKAGKDRLAWSRMSYANNYYPSRMRHGTYAYTITDRPVYRPGHTVKYKIWIRNTREGQLYNAPDQDIRITIYDPRGNKIKEETLHTDQFGGINGEVTLNQEASLGVYRIYVHGRRYAGGQNFRVEEYKKPEFKVSVETSTPHAKLGNKIKAKIKAEYYFGGPVTAGTVTYKIFREEYTHSYHAPGPWDWLYGLGYGYAYYTYDWAPWWPTMKRCWAPPVWWGYHQNPVRELVQQGKSLLSQDGTLEVEIDTVNALKHHSDRDHRYVIQAEIVDPSRRLVKGEGSVKVTRQSYYTFVSSDKGYYNPGEEILLTVKALTPGNEPVSTEGFITITDVVFGGPNNAKIKQTELRRFKVKLDKNGKHSFRFRYEKSGHLRVKFEAPDKWGGLVEGYGHIWVAGRDFDGKLYRFNDLELITDKRTYKPGDTAHVMINTKHPGSYVIYSDKVDNNRLLNYRLLRLKGKSTIVDIPITKHSAPNFFIEATTVHNMRIHTQTRQILVPPKKSVVNLVVKSNKPDYRPGERAEIEVVAKDFYGKPVAAQVTLSAFDKSVLYIQNESTPEIKKFFHGRLRSHYASSETNLTEQLSAWGYVRRPFQYIYPAPPAWYGVWGPGSSDWRSIGDDELDDLGGIDVDRTESATMQRAGGRRSPMSNAVAKNGGHAFAGAKQDKKAELSSDSRDQGAGEGQNKSKGSSGSSSQSHAKTTIRKKFADTALWLTTLTTDENGKAKASFNMPDNLTGWKINAWAMTRDSKVGQSNNAATTSKNLIVRLQTPRFFMERDEVVISANIHNYLPVSKRVHVVLNLPSKHLKLIGGTQLKLDVDVSSQSQTRIDWRVKVLKEGTAAITVKALTDTESDAMQMTFPVLVHGMTKQVATTGSMRPNQTNKTATITLNIPKQRRPDLTRLEVQFAPSLVGPMLDALPYLLDYPYRSTDATVSRFVPAVLTLRTLRNMGIKLEDIKKIRGRMAEIRRIEKGEKVSLYSHIDNPIFEQKRLEQIIKVSLTRLRNMQHGDGGWSWWSRGKSSSYFTSYILNALNEAALADVKIDQNMVNRGMNYLRNWESREMRKNHWGVGAQHAFNAYVLSAKKIRVKIRPAKKDKRNPDLIERLYEGRDKLGIYGKALLAMTLYNFDDKDRAKIVLQNIMQYKKENKETQIAWFRTPGSYWWYWWNNNIEANAWALKAIVKIDPKSDLAPRLIKWLLNNRKNGYYWRSTRDTTFCLSAMSDFAIATGETDPDYTLTLNYNNGQSVKTIKINKDNFFTYDNKFILQGVTLKGGKQTLKITKKGKGALYFNTYLSYFTTEDNIKAAGHELKVARNYFKLSQIPYTVSVQTSDGKTTKENRLRYKKIPLKTGETVKSGDTILVELKVTSDNNYTYLAFEDMKHAGFEPLQVKSGGKGQEGFFSYMEIRDEKTVFFVNNIDQGTHLLRYRMRAEAPGVFHALPAKLFAVYVPELKANSNEHVVNITD